MATRILPFLLLLAGCCTPDQVQPALETARLLSDAFQAEQTNVRAYIESGDPPANQFQAFTNAQDQSRAQFLTIYYAHVQHLMSIGQFDSAAVEGTLKAIEQMIREAKQ